MLETETRGIISHDEMIAQWRGTIMPCLEASMHIGLRWQWTFSEQADRLLLSQSSAYYRLVMPATGCGKCALPYEITGKGGFTELAQVIGHNDSIHLGKV